MPGSSSSSTAASKRVIPLCNEWVTSAVCTADQLKFLVYIERHLPPSSGLKLKNPQLSYLYRAKPSSDWGPIDELFLCRSNKGDCCLVISSNNDSNNDIELALRQQQLNAKKLPSITKLYSQSTPGYCRDYLLLHFYVEEPANFARLITAIKKLNPIDKNMQNLFFSCLKTMHQLSQKTGPLIGPSKHDCANIFFEKINNHHYPWKEAFYVGTDSFSYAGWTPRALGQRLLLEFQPSRDALLRVKTPVTHALILNQQYEECYNLLHQNPNLLYERDITGRTIAEHVIQLKDPKAATALYYHFSRASSGNTELDIFYEFVGHQLLHMDTKEPRLIKKQSQMRLQHAEELVEARKQLQEKLFAREYTRPILHQLIIQNHENDAVTHIQRESEGIDEEDIYGFTPLFLATCYSQTNAVKALLSAGAKPRDIHSHHGTYSILAHTKNETIMYLLLKNMPNKSIIKNLYYILRKLAQSKKPRAMSALLSYIDSEHVEKTQIHTELLPDNLRLVEIVAFEASQSSCLDMFRMLLTHHHQFIRRPKNPSRLSREVIAEIDTFNHYILRQYYPQLDRPRVRETLPANFCIVTHLHSDKHGSFYSHIKPIVLLKPWEIMQCLQLYGGTFADMINATEKEGLGVIQIIVKVSREESPLVCSLFTFDAVPYPKANPEKIQLYLQLAVVRDEKKQGIITEGRPRSFRGLGFVNLIMLGVISFKYAVNAIPVKLYYNILHAGSFTTVPVGIHAYPMKQTLQALAKALMHNVGKTMTNDGLIAKSLTLKTKPQATHQSAPAGAPSVRAKSPRHPRYAFFAELTGGREDRMLPIAWEVTTLSKEMAEKIADPRQACVPLSGSEIYFYHLLKNGIQYHHIEEMATAWIESGLLAWVLLKGCQIPSPEPTAAASSSASSSAVASSSSPGTAALMMLKGHSCL